MLSKLERAPNFQVSIFRDTWAKGNMIDRNGGAYTAYITNSKGQTVGAEIHYDPNYIMSAEGQAAYLQNAQRWYTPSLSGITVEQALAHEMGHAFGV